MKADKDPSSAIPSGCQHCGGKQGEKARVFCFPNSSKPIYLSYYLSNDCSGQKFHSQQMKQAGLDCKALHKAMRGQGYSRASATCSNTSVKGSAVSLSCSPTNASASATSYSSCRPGSAACLSVNFHDKGCGANATERHALKAGQCVRRMDDGKRHSSMVKASCNRSDGAITVLEWKNASTCSGRAAETHTLKRGACSSNLPIKTAGCGVQSSGNGSGEKRPPCPRPSLLSLAPRRARACDSARLSRAESRTLARQCDNAARHRGGGARAS